MTPQERALVMELVAAPSREPLSGEAFLDGFGATDGQVLGLGLLRDAVARRDPVDVELALVVGFKFGLSGAYVPLLNSLAFADWHRRHEDVAMGLGRIGSFESIDALAHLAEWVPDYLEYDTSRALAVKAIWALGALSDERARKVLESLTLSNEGIVAENARRQIEK